MNALWIETPVDVNPILTLQPGRYIRDNGIWKRNGNCVDSSERCAKLNEMLAEVEAKETSMLRSSRLYADMVYESVLC